MNSYAIIILITLVIEYLLGTYADILNLSRLESTPPQEMQGVYDPEKYKTSQNYTRARTTFGLFTSSFMLVLMLLFWFLEGFNLLDQVVRTWGLGPLATGLAYIGVLLLCRKIISLPFSLYSTFVIEARFGFNQTTPAVYISDLVKGTLLSLLLGVPILAALLSFFESAGPAAWLYAWGATTVFALFIQLIAPTWIMPLFNQFKPLEAGELKDAIMAFAQSVHFPLQNVFVMDGSRRTKKSNAFFTGFGKNKRIALFDTLIENHTTPELVSILAHEIGHYKKKHIL
ncbi:MAG: M48 family metallopeptidase, partial [Nitrospiria bacterium]